MKSYMDTMEAFLYGSQFRRLLEKEMDPVQKQYGLQKIDIQVLYYLNSSGEHNTAKDILSKKMFTKGHISQSLSRLQEKGYVTTEHDREDRRCTHIYLTPASEEIIVNVRAVYKELKDIIFCGVTKEEQEVMKKVAQKVSKNIEKAVLE